MNYNHRKIENRIFMAYKMTFYDMALNWQWFSNKCLINK
jgi:hypothetical protein